MARLVYLTTVLIVSLRGIVSVCLLHMFCFSYFPGLYDICCSFGLFDYSTESVNEIIGSVCLFFVLSLWVAFWDYVGIISLFQDITMDSGGPVAFSNKNSLCFHGTHDKSLLVVAPSNKQVQITVVALGNKNPLVSMATMLNSP